MLEGPQQTPERAPARTVDPLAALARRIETRQATVGVIGLGYVGLPLGCTIVEAGLRVAGFDVDAAKIAKLANGGSYIRHVSPDRVRAVLSTERSVKAFAADGAAPGFVPTTEFSELAWCDAIVICVPTPLTEGREPDLSFVTGTAKTVAKYLRPGQLVVLESTTYPGTTDEVVQPILEHGGLQAGRDFALAFSPEREDPGNPGYSTRTIPKLVGGVTPRCGDLAETLYRSFIERVVRVSSARVAESAKLLENIFRSINIALVNELKMLFDRMGIDVWEVIDAAATKPFGFMPFHPGPGLGGHCIPIDPFYLTWKARHYDFATRFIELAGEINTAMPYYVVDRLVEALGQHGRALPGARVLVLGVAYKKDVDDLRDSPALKLIEVLESRGALVSYNDPHVPSLRSRRLRHYDTFRLDSTPLTSETLAEADAVLIATDHGAYDYDWVVAQSRLVVDTRNAMRAVQTGREKIVKA
ncbi:MAG: nucleotide sugar dehydrogenase [Candidatus Binatia bacterium]